MTHSVPSIRITDLRQCPQYLEQLATWHHEEWANLNPGQSLEQRLVSMQDYLGKKVIPSTFVALGEDNETLMGSAALIENDMDTRPDLTPWLASVFVAPAFRRQGVGRALINRVIQHCYHNQIPRLYLFTPDQERFYATSGWQTLGHCEYRNHDITVMAIESRP